MKKITELTAKQIEAMPRYVAEWTAHGLSTQPANRADAERAIAMMYKGAGLDAPEIVWADMPICALMIYARALPFIDARLCAAAFRGLL